jgi:hypothetical protein
MGTMHENGHQFTALQCKNKYENLKNQYKFRKINLGQMVREIENGSSTK